MYKEVVFDSQLRTGEIGFLSNIIENHDERVVSAATSQRQIFRTKTKSTCRRVLFPARDSVYLSGQEIGMENCAFPDIDAYDDISTLDDYRVCLDAGCTKEQALELAHRFSRDNARTPVQWSDDKYAGFSTQEPWLMVNPDYKEINVKKQEKEPDSELAFFK